MLQTKYHPLSLFLPLPGKPGSIDLLFYNCMAGLQFLKYIILADIESLVPQIQEGVVSNGMKCT